MRRQGVLAIVVLGCCQFLNAAPQSHLNCLLRQGNTLWAGTFGHGLLRSDDDGQSWTQARLPVDVTRVLSLAVMKSENVVAGSESAGVWRSADRGESWSRWDAGLPDRVTVESLFVDSADSIWAGTTDDGLFRHDPNDALWYRVKNWPSSSAVSKILARRGAIFVGTWGDGLFRSEDRGKTWLRCTGIPETMLVADMGKDDGDRIIVGSQDGAIYSLDESGRSWARLSTGDLPAPMYQLQLLHDGHIVAATTRGVFMTEPDATRWTQYAGPDEPMLGCVLWNTDDSGFHVVNRISTSTGQ